jgi:GNAT superfamily N-acetyltransferase
MSVSIRKFEPRDEDSFRKIYVEVSSRTIITSATKRFFVLVPYWLRFILVCVAISIERWHYGAIVILICYVGPTLFGYVAYFDAMFDADLRNPCEYYNRKGNALFIAEVVDESGFKQVVGTAGVARASVNKGGHFKGLRQTGDAELKRLNIIESARGMGISKLLFDEVLKFCQDEENESYQRIILTTSSIQEVACNHLYPKLGFQELKVIHVLCIFRIVFFARNIRN